MIKFLKSICIFKIYKFVHFRCNDLFNIQLLVYIICIKCNLVCLKLNLLQFYKISLLKLVEAGNEKSGRAFGIYEPFQNFI